VTPTDGIALAAAAAAAATGLLLLVTGPAVLTGALLVAAAAAIPWWLDPQPGSAPLFTLSLVLGSAAPALAAAAGAAWPTGPLARPSQVVLVGALICALGLGGLVPTLLFDPAAAGCHGCPRNMLLLHSAADAANWCWRAASVGTLIWGPALAMVALRRLRTAPALVRRHAWPVLSSGATIAVLASLSGAHELTLPLGEADTTIRHLRVAEGCLVVLMAAAIWVRAVLVRTAGHRMARTVVGAIPDPAGVVNALRRMLGDPGLTVAFTRLDGGNVDRDGLPAASDGTRAVVRLEREGQAFAELRHDPRLAGSTDLLAAGVSSASLTLEYLAAQARLRAETRDVVALRTRTVAAGDAERQRLERDLHDGAQQGLIALGVLLAMSSEDGDEAWRRSAQAELDAVLRELRSIAHGLFPAALAEGDLVAALRELGDHTPGPLVITASLTGAVPVPSGMAVYQLLHDLTAAAPPAQPVEVALSGGGLEPTRVTAQVDWVENWPDAPDSAEWSGAVPSWLAHAEDRFVAAGGTLTVLRSPGTLIVEGTVPCGS
jgi:signal transduction histidine kinase